MNQNHIKYSMTEDMNLAFDSLCELIALQRPQMGEIIYAGVELSTGGWYIVTELVF